MSTTVVGQGGCIDCKHSFMHEQLGVSGLFCRRYPPHLQPIQQGNRLAFVSLFVAVEKFGRCGEHTHPEATQ